METSITPFRWYDQFYKQNRFEKDCSDEREFKLITDRKYLLPFQFKRSASGQLIEKWILRRSCDDYEPRVLSASNEQFLQGISDWIPSESFSWSDCDFIKSGKINADELFLSGKLTTGKQYRYVLVVPEVKRGTGSTLDLTLLSDADVILDDINEPGAYDGTFTASNGNLTIRVNDSGGGDADDFIGIKSLEIFELFDEMPNDVELDTSLLTLANYGAYDYIFHCGNDMPVLNGSQLPLGEWYSIMIDYAGNAYFSEVFTVKNFFDEKCPYFKLEWKNSCDIQDVIYSNASCEFKNRLYLDEAAISKPEYPFTEEGTMNGSQEFSPTFQKWEKKLSFLIGKSPGFLTDSLTAIKLHNQIEIRMPLRHKQSTSGLSIEVASVEYEVSSILDDCFSNVNLKILLSDKYVDETCCNNNTLTTCETCSIVTADLNTLDVEVGYAWLISKDGYPIDGLYQYDALEEVWVLLEPDDYTIICIGEADKAEMMIFFEGLWYDCPNIFEWGTTSGWTPDRFFLTGFAMPNSFVQAEISTDGGTTWTKDSQILSNTAYGFPGLYIPYVDNGLNVYIRIRNFTLNCDYGYSPSVAWDFSE